MMDGQVYLHLNLGSGSRKVKLTIRRVDDGRWHEITYSRDGRAGVLSVDELLLDFAMQGTPYVACILLIHIYVIRENNVKHFILENINAMKMIY